MTKKRASLVGYHGLWGHAYSERERVWAIWRKQPWRIGIIATAVYSHFNSWRDRVIPLMRGVNKMKQIR